MYRYVDECFFANDTDPILEKFADSIESFGYTTSILEYNINKEVTIESSDLA